MAETLVVIVGVAVGVALSSIVSEAVPSVWAIEMLYVQADRIIPRKKNLRYLMVGFILLLRCGANDAF